MKNVLLIFICLACFACGKEESDLLISRYTPKEIFNAVTGTWIYSRWAHDAEFKQPFPIEVEECGKKDYTILKPDSTITRIDNCVNDIEIGKFEVAFGGQYEEVNDVRINSYKSGLNLIPGGRHQSGVLYSFTDSTLVFHKVRYYKLGSEEPDIYLFVEIKRVKE